MKPIRVWQGKRIIGINTGGQPFPVPQGECIFVDCIDCIMSIKLYYGSKADNLATSDAEARKYFRSYGWAISGNTIRCPECRKTKPKNLKV